MAKPARKKSTRKSGRSVKDLPTAAARAKAASRRDVRGGDASLMWSTMSTLAQSAQADMKAAKQLKQSMQTDPLRDPRRYL